MRTYLPHSIFNSTKIIAPKSIASTPIKVRIDQIQRILPKCANRVCTLTAGRILIERSKMITKGNNMPDWFTSNIANLP